MQEINLSALFLTGLLTGGLTCLAVQGGLLATTIARTEEARLKNELEKGSSATPVILFLLAKLVVYTMLGAVLGWLGSVLTLSIQASALLQGAVAIFILGTAFNLLNVHPIFRYFVIQPPRFLTRLIRKQSKSTHAFTPLALGAFTVFIPCPSTQAAMALAIASGNPVMGALILFVFTLGTSPLFLALGFFAGRLSGILEERFLKLAAVIILLLGIYTLNGAIALSGSTVTLQSIARQVFCTVSYCDDSAVFAASIASPVTDATIVISKNGYTPNSLAVKAGSDVTLRLVNNGGGGSCAQAFTIPKLNIKRLVTEGKQDTISFKAPQEKGEFAFMCSMGMYPGIIKVI